MKTMKQKIEEKIRINKNNCWIWVGTKNNDGYGTIIVNYKRKRAHRVSYETYIGPILTGLLICHKCDSPLCVNPEHLFMGTFTDNNLDCSKKRRNLNSKKQFCSKGHPFDYKNTYNYRNKRMCIKCRNIRSSQYNIKIRSNSNAGM